MEINPNHPVTSAVREHWHKIVALLLHKFELGDVLLTQADLERFLAECPDHVVALHDKADGMHLKIITREEAERLGREHGGLPA